MTANGVTRIDLERLRRVHLVGIGGMHMSAIAAILLSRGVQVSGSDLALSSYTERLAAAGAEIHLGHDAAFLGDPDLVVATVAATEANPELVAARAHGIPVAIRAEMVAALMRGRTAVCIAGTHGKTTTSALIAYALVSAGREPAYLLGGDSVDLGGNAAPGRGPEIVVEADEYAEAFLHYEPDIALVTNVEIDHLDYYKTEARVEGAFGAFLRRVRPDGTAVVCADSPRLMTLALGPGRPECRVETYSIERPSDWLGVVLDDGYPQRFEVRHDRATYGTFETPLAGSHMVSNCVGAIAILDRLGVTETEIRAAVATFHGAKRRFEYVGEAGGITVMDDYAHHPTEIAANLAAARRRFRGRRLVAVFQPHTFSRTSYLLDDFRRCFEQADTLLIMQTFAARETSAAGLDGRDLAAVVTAPAPAFAETRGDAVAWLAANTRPGDVVFTFGAGSVDAVGRGLLEALRA